MNTVRDIYSFLHSLAPEKYAMEGDRIGLLCGHMDAPVTKLVVSLDASIEAAEEAAKLGAELLLTHHPVYWNLAAVNDTNPAGKTILFLAEHGIAALNAHTNLDCAPGGVNDCLAEKLKLRDVRVMDPDGQDRLGRDWGLIRIGTVEEISPEDFAAFVKKQLSCKGLRYVAGDHPIRKVAVGGGACADSLYRVAELGYDAFVTADAKYHSFRDAKDLGVTFIDAGHFQTENPVCKYLAAQIRSAFPQMEVMISKKHKDCIKFL